jgi:transcriptional regulator with XRE-family HTH domain
MFKFVGETLRRLRKERGKTLEQLGEEAGLGRGQLSRIENSRQESTLTTLAKILTSQGVSRRDFFHRYDLVEGEALAVERTAAGAHPPAGGAPANPGDWPEEIREVLGKLESFVDMTFLQPRPVAQGAIELGHLVDLFRVVPKGAPEAQAAAAATPPTPPAAPMPPEPAAPAPPEPVSARKSYGRNKKKR